MMETYYRKRSKKAQQPTMSGQKEAEQGSITAGEPPFLGRLHHHVPPPPPPSSDHCISPILPFAEPEGKTQMQKHIKLGYLYEIDHTQLPPRTPVQLRSIRVAMVCEMTELNVSVRFPSMESLRAFFNYSSRETHPALDEKFVMGSALADRVLIRLVPSEIFSEQKSLVAFWLIGSSAAPDWCMDNVSVGHNNNNKGTYLSEALKANGIVRWGIRRQVKYLGRHKDSDNGNDVNGQNNSSSSFVNGVEESQMGLMVNCEQEKLDEGDGSEEIGDDDDGAESDAESEEKDEGDDQEDEDEEEEEEEEEEDEEEEEEEEEEKKIKVINESLKRKRYPLRNKGGVKKPKIEMIDVKKEKQKKKKKKMKKNQKKKSMGRSRFKEALVLRDPKDRWSAERYKLAEQNLLAVMKSKEATAEKPILRPQLRAEARKKIGDTGLLDHLLKHMAGKIAPGGEERFRRRHNPDGAMEYWLENADLVSIRRDAGVADPYWVPPLGWKLGDSPTQDPICARELKLLKDDVSKIKRDLEVMVTKMQLEEEVGKLKRELEELSSKKREEESQAITITTSRSDISQKLDQLATSLVSSKSDFVNAHVSVEKYKEQLMAISDFVKEIEGKIGKVTTPNVEERAMVVVSSLNAEAEMHSKEKNSVAKESKSKEQEVQALNAAISSDENKTAEKEKTAAEEKAARLQRLKSGFRICKPQGTFLWPNMVNNGTPPSVSSSTASAPPQLPFHHHPASLVKPLAEKRAVAVTVSAASKGPNYEDGSNNYSTTTTALINLNDLPTNQTIMPMLSPSGVYGSRNLIGYSQKEYNTGSCSSITSLPCEVGNWLALSTPKSATDESSRG